MAGRVLMAAGWVVGHENGSHVLYEDGVIPGVDDRAMRNHARAQLDRLVAEYPDRTFGYPPASEIFTSSYPRIETPA